MHEVPDDRQTQQWPLKVVAIIGGGETKDNNHPDINPLCRTEVLKVIGVRSPWCLPGHPSQTAQMVLGIHNETRDDGRKLI